MNLHIRTDMNLRNSNVFKSHPAPQAVARALLALLVALVLPAARAALALDDYVFVYPAGSAEWTSSGDFNGDGLLDVVIVDRASGAYRIGYQAANGTHAWTTPRASGVAEVSGLAVGYLFNAGVHALAFTAEAANRVNVLSATNPAVAGVPVPVFISSVGPNQVIALNIGGAGDTPLHDLIVPTAWNGVAPYRSTSVRNSGGASFSILQDVMASRRLERGNRIVIKDATPPVLSIIERGSTDTLRLISYIGGPQNTFLEITNISPGSDYSVGRFAGNALAHFLVYRPGHSNIFSYSLIEPVAGTFETTPPVGFAFADAIETVVTLPGANGAKLLIIFSRGLHAATYNFDGSTAPVLISEFFPPAGESLLGATPLANNGFRLHSGVGGRTTTSLQHAFNQGAGSYSLVGSNALPPISSLSGQANVFQFQAEPFVSPAPGLLSSLNAGDWSSLFSIGGGPPQLGVVTETFAGTASGLDNPAPVSLGNSHPLAAFGLVNQYTDAVSIFSLAPGLGDQIVEVSATPPGGLYARSVAVNFILGAPGFQVFYRLGQNRPWQLYTGSAVNIFTNSLLQYRASNAAGTLQTAIRSENYTFKQTPSDLDSDSDGVPDYVEIANGLDPVLSGSDADLDGFSDLEELLKGTSPSNPGSQPLTQGYEQHAKVDLVLTPRPLNGLTGSETASRGGPRVRVFDGSSSLLGSGPVGAAPQSAATVSNIFIDPRRHFFVASTEQHFDVAELLPDRRIGREIVGLIPAPVVAPVTVDYQFGAAGGVINAEAAGWVLAAQTAYGNATKEIRHHSLPITATTVAALFEHKLRTIVDTATSSNVNLTLFPFRVPDAGAREIDDEVLVLFEHGDAHRPAYDIRQMLQSLEAMIQAPTPQIQALNSVTHEMYRVSSVSNNHAPGTYPLPLDTLRQFLRQGVIQSNYLAAGVFPASLLADAADAVPFIMDNLGSRLVTNLTLRVRPGKFDGTCTVLETADSAATPVNLFALGGGAYDFPDTFTLLPGSIVHVIGRPDVQSTVCSGLNLEVLAISLSAIPAPTSGDTDGNLLIDAWELLLLGMLGSDPFADGDGDGYSNLQEMFEGSDPNDSAGAPAVPVIPLALPVLDIDSPSPDGLTLAWHWPEAYINQVQFEILATPDLNVAPTPQPISPSYMGGGIFNLTLPKSPDGSQFFQIIIKPR